MVIISLSVEEKNGKYRVNGLNEAINTISTLRKGYYESVEFVNKGLYKDINRGLQQEKDRLEMEKNIYRTIGVTTVFFLVPSVLAEYRCIKLAEKIESLEELSKRLYYQYN